MSGNKEFYRVKTVAEKLDVCPDQVWRMSRSGRFPKPIKLSPRCTVWDAEAVENWVEQQKGRAAYANAD